MKPLPATNPTFHQRKTRYVDETLQRFLLIGLVFLEAGLAAGLAWMMFLRLNGIVEESLYRVHLADAVPILTQLIHEAVILLTIFGVANVVALVVVDLLWRRYINSILRQFMQLMDKTYQLDFTSDPSIRSHHHILDLAVAQRDQDRIRLSAIRDHLSRLEPAMLVTDDTQAVRDIMRALDNLLPQPSTTLSTNRANTAF